MCRGVCRTIRVSTNGGVSRTVGMRLVTPPTRSSTTSLKRLWRNSTCPSCSTYLLTYSRAEKASHQASYGVGHEGTADHRWKISHSEDCGLHQATGCGQEAIFRLP